MIRHFVKKFGIDAALIAVAAAAAFAACVFAHEAMKPVTKAVGFVGPVIFASVSVGLIPILGLAPKYAWAAKARRLMVGIAIGSLVIFTAMFRAEMIYAPIAYLQGATPSVVVEQIASGDNVARFQAWSRLVTFSKEQKEDVARELAPMIAGDDEVARRSAILTLDFPLRRFTMTTLLTLMPDLKVYVDTKAQQQTTAMSPRIERVGQFAQTFVGRNFRSILKAVSAKERGKLPEGGLDVLFLALATEEPIGHLILRGFADQGDDVLKPRAEATLSEAAIAL